jgi:antitoxin CptB
VLQDNQVIDQRSLSKLKWRCRRGLLENDILIKRFFERFESSLTMQQGRSLSVLMELGDNDLLDLNLDRKSLGQVNADLDRDEIREVLCMLKTR